MDEEDDGLIANWLPLAWVWLVAALHHHQSVLSAHSAATSQIHAHASQLVPIGPSSSSSISRKSL